MPKSLTSNYVPGKNLKDSYSGTGKYTPYGSTIPALEKRKERGSGDYDYEIWLARLESTLRWRQNYWNGDKNWNRAYDMFRGKHWRDQQEEDPSSDQLRDRITVNITQSSILNIVPFLMASHPEFQGKPRKPSDTESVKLQTAMLNYDYQQREMHPHVKRSVYDASICGHGIIKTGYNLEIDEAVSKIEGEIFYEDYIKEDAPFVKRVSPFFFLIDPTASEANLETARWCAEIFLKTERDILANDKYDSSVRSKIKDGTYSLTYKNSALGIHSDDPFLNNLSKTTDNPELPESKVAALFEVWDKKYKKYYVFAEGVPDPLIKKDWPYDYLQGFPFIKLDYISLPDEIYGIGIPYQIEDQQFELNRNRTYAFEHRRRFSARKMEVLKGVDEGELTRYLNGEDGVAVRVQQMGSIQPIPDAPMPEDTQLVEGMIRSDIQEMTGLDQLLRGGNLPDRTTAGEVSTRTSLFRLKLDDRIEVVDQFVLRVGRQVLQHIKGNYTSERVIAIVGETGINWKQLTHEMIKEEIDISMESISAPKVDPLLDRQLKMQVWNISMQSLPLIQAGLLKIDLNALYGWLLESFGIKDVGRFFQDALVVKPPLQEQGGQQPQAPQQNVLQFPSAANMFQQVGGANLTNQSGMQLGAQQ